MSFDEIVSDRVRAILVKLGVEATFVPATGEPFTLNVMKREAAGVSPAGLEFRAPEFRTLIRCCIADIGRHAEKGESFVIANVGTFTVRGVDPFETSDWLGAYYVEKTA